MPPSNTLAGYHGGLTSPGNTGEPPMEDSLRKFSDSTTGAGIADAALPPQPASPDESGEGKVTIVMNAPEKIGKYRITGVIGEGVSGVVYKAFDPSLQRVVAVKSLHLNLPPDNRAAREFAGRLGEQAQAISRINHPGIVSVHQIDEADGRAFIAMEHVAGLNLAQWLSVTPLPPQAALLQVMDQMLDALECAHLAGVRHGDRKSVV